jgi:hypothetical protein
MSMIQKAALSALATIILAGSSFGRTVADKDAAKALTDRIMAKAAADDMDGVFDQIKPYLGISAEDLDTDRVKSKQSLEALRPKYGPPTGFEFVDSKTAGSSLLRLRYVLKNTKLPLVWVFDFYKTDAGWMMTNFNWSIDVFSALFK